MGGIESIVGIIAAPFCATTSVAGKILKPDEWDEIVPGTTTCVNNVKSATIAILVMIPVCCVICLIIICACVCGPYCSKFAKKKKDFENNPLGNLAVTATGFVDPTNALSSLTQLAGIGSSITQQQQAVAALNMLIAPQQQIPTMYTPDQQQQQQEMLMMQQQQQPYYYYPQQQQYVQDPNALMVVPSGAMNMYNKNE